MAIKKKPARTAPKKTAAKKPSARPAAGKKSPKPIKGAAKKLLKKAAKKLIKKTAAKTTPKVKSKTLKPIAQPQRAAKQAAGIPEKMRDAALAILDARQAEEVVAFDLKGRSSVADYLIIASGRAGRQIAAIAHYLQEAFEKLGVKNARIEGLPEANWVLVDAGDVIVHLFRPEVRHYYDLERIWGTSKPQA